MKAGTPAASIVLYGESLGTGVAVQMATEGWGSAMVLEAPYTSLVDVAARHYPWAPVRLLMDDRYESIEKIGKVDVPLLIIHGEQDTLIPVAMARDLAAAAREPKRLVTIPDAGHNDLHNHGAGQVIADFVLALDNKGQRKTGTR